MTSIEPSSSIDLVASGIVVSTGESLNVSDSYEFSIVTGGLLGTLSVHQLQIVQYSGIAVTTIPSVVVSFPVMVITECGPSISISLINTTPSSWNYNFSFYKSK